MIKVKEFITKNKEVLLAAIAIIATIASEVSGIGGIVGSVACIIVAILAIFTFIIKNGYNEQVLTLVAAATQLIIKAIAQQNAVVGSDNDVLKSGEKPVASMTLEEIKEELEKTIIIK